MLICDHPGCPNEAAILYCTDCYRKIKQKRAAKAEEAKQEKTPVAKPGPVVLSGICPKCRSLFNSEVKGVVHQCPVG